MSKRDIAGLACKGIAVFIIIQGISVMANLLSFYITVPNMLGMMEAEPIANMISPYIFFLINGVLLWIYSDKLAGVMVKDENNSSIENLNIKTYEIERIIFSVIGLFFMVNSLPDILSDLINIYWLSDLPEASRRVLPSAIGNISKFILGLAIFLGSQGLVNLLKAVRSLGIKEK